MPDDCVPTEEDIGWAVKQVSQIIGEDVGNAWVDFGKAPSYLYVVQSLSRLIFEQRQRYLIDHKNLCNVMYRDKDAAVQTARSEAFAEAAMIAEATALSAADSAQIITENERLRATESETAAQRSRVRNDWVQGQHFFHGKRHGALDIAKAIRSRAANADKVR